MALSKIQSESIDLADNFAGMRFGGTASDNALDDYEEGTWTPVLGGTSGDPTVSYDIQKGWYQKIGNLVCFGGRLQWNTSGSSGGSGDGVIKTLPLQQVGQVKWELEVLL